MVSSNRCNENYNTLDDLSGSFCVPNNAKDVNVKVFNMITKINESKLSGKHTLYDWKWIFDGTKCNLNQNKTTIIGDANIENLK